jgi:probable O-glycosylation ligase (exosortase A-associated)
MLRTIFVLIVVAVGALNSLRGPFYALLFYLWIAYFRPETWVWGGVFRHINLSFYVGIFILILFLLRGERLRINRRTVFLGLIWIHSLGSTLMSDHLSYCWPYWIEFAKIILVTYLLVLLTTSVDKLKLVILVMALSLAFEGAKQGWINLILHPGSINKNEIVFLGDNNCVAVGMLMLVPLLLALMQTFTQKWIKGGFAFVALGVVYRALSTYSRGGFIAFFTMCGLFWARSRFKIGSLILVCALAGVALQVFPDAFWQRMKTITMSQEEMDASAAGRMYFWGIGAKMGMQNPFFGIGHNGYRASYDEYDQTKAYGGGRSVHSMWFGIFSESGFPGLLILLLIYYQSLRGCARARRICGDDQNQAFLKRCATAIETGLVTAAIGGAFLPFQYVEMLWHFFGLSIAVEQIALSTVQVTESAEQDADAVQSGVEPVPAPVLT